MSFGLEPLYTKIRELEEKFEKIMRIFYDQPDIVLEWTPDKKYYAWGMVGPARGQRMLEDILKILTSEDQKDEV